MVKEETSAEVLADEIDKALISEYESSIEQGGKIIVVIISFLAAGGIKAIGFKSYRSYFEIRLKPNGVSQSRFYRLKDSAMFCRDEAVELNDESAQSVIAIANAIQNDRARIWNELKEEEGCEIPSATKIAERIKRNSVTAKDRAKATSKDQVARAAFKKLIDDPTSNFDQITLQINARKATLNADKYGIEKLSADDFQQLERLVADHLGGIKF